MKNTRSLRTTLIKLVVVPAIVVILSLFGIIALGVVLIQNELVQRQQFLINTLALQGDQYLDETDRFMHVLVNTLIKLPPESQQNFLAQSRLNYPRFSTLYLVDETGKVLIEDTGTTTFLGLDLSNTHFFNEAQKSNRTFFSEPFISLATGQIAVTGATPVYIDRQFRGMLVGELYLAQLQEAIEQIDTGEEGLSFIVDRRGTLIAHPNQSWVQEQHNLNNLSIVQKGLAGQNTFELFFDKTQGRWLVGSVTSMRKNWAVVATQPAVIATRPLQILLLVSTLALAVSFFLYIWIQRYTVRQITPPISMLAQKVNALSQGDYEPLSTGQMGQFTEIITLGQSFNRMVDAVSERTIKLLAANESLEKELQERKRIEKALRESETNLARAQQIAHLGSYSWDIETDKIYWSEELKSILGVATQAPSYEIITSLIHPDDVDQVIEIGRLEQYPYSVEYRIIRPDGKIRHIHDQVEIIKDSDGHPIQVMGTSLDITERKEAEETLRKQETQLRLMAANIPGVVYQFLLNLDGSQEIPYISDRCYEFLGLHPQEIQEDISRVLDFVQTEDVDLFQEVIIASALNMTDYIFDHFVRKPTGEEIWLRLRATPQKLNNGSVLWNGVAIDITERKESEKQIQASLREKEVLLREVHHRVKNNLQVVCALLDLQADTIDNEQSHEALQESRIRVRSMAQIHEQLTHNENLAQVNMALYIEELVSSLRIAYGAEATAIKIDVSDVTLPFDSVSPCGLLINELISNAIKHAFPPAEKEEAFNARNKIEILLHPIIDTEKLELIIKDNGRGLPKEIDLHNPTSLGLTLVKLLIHQINATVEVDRTGGTTFRITFTP